MSRSRTPKHLLALLSERTLIEETVRRLEGAVPLNNIFVLTAEAQLEGVRLALPFLPPDQIVAEPARRDTAPAAALATALIRQRDPDAVMGLFPADAFIRDADAFARQLRAAFALFESAGEPASNLPVKEGERGGQGGPVSAAAPESGAEGSGAQAGAASLGGAREKPGLGKDTLLTFGIRPSFPATGFGYLELGEELTFDRIPVRRVLKFVEKPDAATARRYVESGHFVWNAGMFVWRAEAFLAEAQRSAPELAKFIHEFPHRDRTIYIRDRFPALPRISVDYAIMEKARSVATVLAEFDWDDVGAWSALPSHLPADEAGNTVRGPVAAVDASGNIAISNGRLIALCGVQNLVVVETADAILVCHRDRVQDIKRLQPLLPQELQ